MVFFSCHVLFSLFFCFTLFCLGSYFQGFCSVLSSPGKTFVFPCPVLFCNPLCTVYIMYFLSSFVLIWLGLGCFEYCLVLSGSVCPVFLQSFIILSLLSCLFVFLLSWLIEYCSSCLLLSWLVMSFLVHTVLSSLVLSYLVHTVLSSLVLSYLELYDILLSCLSLSRIILSCLLLSCPVLNWTVFCCPVLNFPIFLLQFHVFSKSSSVLFWRTRPQSV